MTGTESTAVPGAAAGLLMRGTILYAGPAGQAGAVADQTGYGSARALRRSLRRSVPIQP